MHSKILLHDLPTAALSAFAFLAFLKWYRSENVLWLAAIAVLLAAGFLAKGPFVFVVFCSGITALICLEPESRMLILRRKNRNCCDNARITGTVCALVYPCLLNRPDVHRRQLLSRAFCAPDRQNKLAAPRVIVAHVDSLAIPLVGSFWWHATHGLSMAVSATILWLTLIGMLYPTFGANNIPSRIIERVREQRIVLYGEPKPALLPILMRRSLEVKRYIQNTDLIPDDGGAPWIFVGEARARQFEETLSAAGFQTRPIDSYKTLPSIHLALRSFRRESTRGGWLLAIRSRSLEPIQETVFLYKLE